MRAVLEPRRQSDTAQPSQSVSPAPRRANRQVTSNLTKGFPVARIRILVIIGAAVAFAGAFAEHRSRSQPVRCSADQLPERRLPERRLSRRRLSRRRLPRWELPRWRLSIGWPPMAWSTWQPPPTCRHAPRLASPMVQLAQPVRAHGVWSTCRTRGTADCETANELELGDRQLPHLSNRSSVRPQLAGTIRRRWRRLLPYARMAGRHDPFRSRLRSGTVVSVWEIRPLHEKHPGC